MTRIQLGRWALSAVIGAGLFCAGIVAYLGYFRRIPEAPKVVAEPTCQIRFLSAGERLHPARVHEIDAREIELPYPADQVGNPILFNNRFAVVRFANTGAPRSRFSRSRPEVPGRNKMLLISKNLNAA